MLTLATITLFVSVSLGAQESTDAVDPKDARFATVAESSDWRATSTHAEVMELVESLADGFERVHLEEAGRTIEGRPLPLLVVADPPVEDPGDVGERLVAFAWAGIHSGEVCGKPATLMLARELAAAQDPELLKHLVVVLLPLLNADGNDRMDPGNRRGQHGPVEGMGIRPNAQGLNINRDFTKLETLEARAIAGVLSRWQPAIAMDLHTTNGSLHQYTLTYDGQRHPLSDPGLLRLTREELLPTVGDSLEEATGYRSFFYGNFDREHTRWLTYPGQPRYSTHYLGLRHHIGVLSEAYSYASYEERVLGTREFVRHCFRYVADHRDEVGAAIAAARGGAPEEICLRQRTVLSEGTIEVLGFEPADSPGRREVQGAPRAYEVRHDLASESTLSVETPVAYLVPANLSAVLENLGLHGIELLELVEPAELDLEVYRVASITRSQRDYEKHRMLQVEVDVSTDRRAVPAGTVVVRTSQALGSLAAYLLEPQAEDGLVAWNFLDDSLAQGEEYPVLRLAQEEVMVTRELPH